MLRAGHIINIVQRLVPNFWSDDHAFEEFEKDNKFKDDHAFKEFEDEFKANHAFEEFENKFKDDHAFEEFEDENEFNDDHVFEEFKEDNKFKDDHAFEEFENKFKDERPCLRRVQKRVQNSGLEIWTDLHLQVRGPKCGWLGTLADRVRKFGQDQLPEETIRISQLYEPKSINKLIKVKCVYIWSLIYTSSIP